MLGGQNVFHDDDAFFVEDQLSHKDWMGPPSICLSIYLSIYLYIYTHKILGIIGSSEMDTFQPEWGFIVELWSSISNVGYVYGSFLFPQTIRFLRLIILTYLPRAVSWEDDFLAKENMFQHVPTHQPMLKLGLEQWILVDVFYGHVRPFGDDSTIIPVRSQSVTIHEICEEHGLWMFQCWSIWPGEFSPAITTCSPWRGGEIGVAAFGGVRMRCRIYNDISWRSTCGCPIRYKLYTYVYVCMYIYMHTYIHPSIHTYIHTYIMTYCVCIILFHHLSRPVVPSLKNQTVKLAPPRRRPWRNLLPFSSNIRGLKSSQLGFANAKSENPFIQQKIIFFSRSTKIWKNPSILAKVLHVELPCAVTLHLRYTTRNPVDTWPGSWRACSASRCSCSARSRSCKACCMDQNMWNMG